MNGNSRMVGAVLMGVGAGVLAYYFQNVKKKQYKHITRKLARDAHQSWEGEGGSIIDSAQRMTAG